MNYKQEYKFAKAREKEEKRDLREKKKEERRAKRQRFYDTLWVKAEHLAPPGEDVEKFRTRYFVVLGVCVGAMFIQFIATWNVAHTNLFTWTDGRQMKMGAMLPGFLHLIRGTYHWFSLSFVYLLFCLIENYTCYYWESKSIYVMKRLPSRMEIHKRAWSLPVLGAAGTLIVLGLTVLFCLLVYLLCSPWECIPEIWFRELVGLGSL